MIVRVWLGIASICLCAASWAQTTVLLRGGGEVIASSVEVSDAGLSITTTLGPQAIPWHRVRAVNGEAEPAVAPYVSAAEDAWRGLSRLERGDPYAAELPLERAYEALARGRSTASAAAIAEGLARCRLSRGDAPGALEPWLTLLACEAAGVWAPSGPDPILDSATGLVPLLSPSLIVSLPPGGARNAAAAIADTDRWPVGRIRDFARLYAAAFAFEAGTSSRLVEPTATDSGLMLLHAVVASRVGDDTARRIARRQLWDLLIGDADEWSDAWCEAALGFSLARESESEQRAAVAHLLAVPARHGSSHPLLAGACVAEAAALLDAMGRSSEAAALARELQQGYAGHPALERPDIQRLIRPRASTLEPATPQGSGERV